MNAPGRNSAGCLTCTALPILAAALLLAAYIGLRGLGAFLITGQEAQPGDAIVLLGGGDADRRAEAVQLYAEEMGQYVILTDTGEEVVEFGVDYIRIVREQLVQAGVPDGAILETSHPADSTRGEAWRVRELMEQRGLTSAIIVTDPYHTRRTQLVFEKAFDGSEARIIVRPVRSHWYRSDRWFLSPEGWRVTLLELSKLGAFWLGIEVG